MNLSSLSEKLKKAITFTLLFRKQRFRLNAFFWRFPIGSGFSLYLFCAELVSVSHQISDSDLSSKSFKILN